MYIKHIMFEDDIILEVGLAGDSDDGSEFGELRRGLAG